MEVFARTAEARSLSDAARKLGVSKSAISKQITQMEHALGVCVLHRTTRSVTMAEIGTAFYQRCRRRSRVSRHAFSVGAARPAEAPRAGRFRRAPPDAGAAEAARALPRASR